MLKLPGVGPKMANLCMATAWGKVHGIGKNCSFGDYQFKNNVESEG